ncbi:phosphoribosylamine--glycine ligase [Lacticaseibacillus chiayiensis]|uniref:phosphoribosylamine--glycine ligase n=1 Tax=Lacticaseibacillus chiayiensis TaxID=2100821 RepID=UPI001010E0F8|nr:phosphoribosylamine--glycine ligase [Lacticaseibacillus chiayiensis]RXT59316.1 phosphoribosylamine--glycine ligase [Lacticaseibacillus chiayiensis]
MKKVLVIGGGARESALALKFNQSPQVDHVYVAPGNPAMTLLGVEPIGISEAEVPALILFARDHQIDLTFVGPEVPLAEGIVDAFQEANQPIFGVTKKLAQLESSKTFAKDFMHRHHLPTAASKTVHSALEAHAEATLMGLPIVLKKDGLAGGKGVIIAQDATALDDAIDQLYERHPSATVLLEQYLDGEEASVMALFNGQNRVILPLSQDHKRRFAADRGPNTGGMGAISPLPQFTANQVQSAQSLVDKTLAGMQEDGLSGQGVMYIGLIFTSDGPKILEYNMRFGDPETQVLLPQIENDFYQMVTDLSNGQQPDLTVNGRAYACFVAVNPDYPESGHKSVPVIVPNDWSIGTWLPAGVNQIENGWISNSGRIFSVVSGAPTLSEAVSKAKAALESIQGVLDYRTDIGFHALKA